MARTFKHVGKGRFEEVQSEARPINRGQLIQIQDGLATTRDAHATSQAIFEVEIATIQALLDQDDALMP